MISKLRSRATLHHPCTALSTPDRHRSKQHPLRPPGPSWSKSETRDHTTGPLSVTAYTMDRYLTRSQSSVSILQCNLGPACTLIVEDSSQPVPPSQHALPSKTILTPELLVDINLQAFAQQLTRGITQKVGKISRELGGVK